jgi:hypothetical protein
MAGLANKAPAISPAEISLLIRASPYDIVIERLTNLCCLFPAKGEHRFYGIEDARHQVLIYINLFSNTMADGRSGS